MLPPVVDGRRAPNLEEETACQALTAETFKEACTSDMQKEKETKVPTNKVF